MALVVDGGVTHAPKRKMPPPPLDVAKGPCSEPVAADDLFHTTNVAVGRGPIGTTAQRGESEPDSGVDLTGTASVAPLDSSSEIGKRSAQCTMAGESLSKDCEVFGEQSGGRELQAV